MCGPPTGWGFARLSAALDSPCKMADAQIQWMQSKAADLISGLSNLWLVD